MCQCGVAADSRSWLTRARWRLWEPDELHISKLDFLTFSGECDLSRRQPASAGLAGLGSVHPLNHRATLDNALKPVPPSRPFGRRPTRQRAGWTRSGADVIFALTTESPPSQGRIQRG